MPGRIIKISPAFPDAFAKCLPSILNPGSVAGTIAKPASTSRRPVVTGGVAHHFNNLLMVVLGNCKDCALIAATGDAVSALAAKGASAAIPIVFVIGGDQVRFDLVESINRPGGNITGVSLISSALGAKRLGLMYDLVPNAAVVGLLINPDNPNAEPERKDVQEAAQTIGQKLHVVTAKNESELGPAFASLIEQRVGGLLVATDPFLLSQREQLVALSARHVIPTMYQFREFATAGGLMSYGTNITGAYRQAGLYRGQILKGDKPADLPIFQQTKLELVINLKTAKALGLTVPATLLARADEVIE